MKESAQNSDKNRKKLSYSQFGKFTKGFLCMATLFVFALSMAFCMYGALIYGVNIISDLEGDYFKTDKYEAAISQEAANLLHTIGNAASADSKFSITYVEEETIKKYETIEYAYGKHSWDHFFMDEETYSATSLNYPSSKFYEIYTLEAYLKTSLAENNYLYFSESAFQKIFKDYGLVNLDHRFSGDFSESAYFVFECDELTRQFLAETNNAETIISKMTYAVYDPEGNVYYSTEDAYFEPMNRYIYSTADIQYTLEGNSIYKLQESNVLFLLLRSPNLYHASMSDQVAAGYEFMLREKGRLEAREDSNFYYYFDSPSFTSKNVDLLSDITDLEYAYQIENGKLSFAGTGKNEITDYSALIEPILDAYNNSQVESDSVFCFGIQPMGAASEDSSEIIQKFFQYNIYSKGTKVAVVVAVITFILLIIQVVSMIRTTGKEKFDSVEITLNRYDRLPTEIWLVINVTVLMICLLLYILMTERLYYSNVIWDVLRYMLVSASTIPFGFFFMVITLSLARRIKAHNLWKGSFMYWLNCKLTGKQMESENAERRNVPKSKLALKIDEWKEYIGKIKGTKKLLLVFVIYVVASIFLCWVAVDSAMTYDDSDLPLFMFMVLQVAAIVAVILVIKDIDKLIQGVTAITKGNLNCKVEINEKASVFRELADGINHIGDGLKSAVETSLKDERMKTELITNVSHDLKTPLTSIINYIDLLKKEDIQSEDSKHYIEVLDAKSQRLKQLTEDLVEAAKATSGNIELEMMPLTFDELMKQALGEFEDKFEKRNLTVIATYPGEPAVIIADGRRLYRIIENVLQNIYKYAMEGTRVYADLAKDEGMVTFTLKNISASPLNISPEELMERFTRGDSSRTTEGSGLGLSIAKELTRLQNGTFEIQLDGDLFKVIIKFSQHIAEK